MMNSAVSGEQIWRLKGGGCSRNLVFPPYLLPGAGLSMAISKRCTVEMVGAFCGAI